MQVGFARKYAIMEELDGGFSAGSMPEAFVRLDSWEGRIQASIHVKGLKQGPFKYVLYLIFVRNDKLIPILLGTVNTSYSGMQSGLEIEAETLRNNNLKPDSVRFAALTAESQNKKWIPLFASFEKSHKWDESIRQVILMSSREEEKPKTPEPDISYTGNTTDSQIIQPAIKEETVDTPPLSDITADNTPQPDSINYSSLIYQDAYSPKSNYEKKKTKRENTSNKQCDIGKLEGLLMNNFETHIPFNRSSRGYSWYRVSDLAKLSNIMYMSGINVPLFANPKILVGLFKFKHILAGLYRGGNGSEYYVIGVPAKNEKDNKPFDNACRWAPIQDTSIRDMGGYWLVYVSLKSGEIVV
ncbi:MAG: hypothetical protein GX236_09010 [Clostridiaceae bacterium]|jgi:hypothetical protein|nr:hypothetical protein [Clostridiaceae bacterium]